MGFQCSRASSEKWETLEAVRAYLVPAQVHYVTEGSLRNQRASAI